MSNGDDSRTTIGESTRVRLGMVYALCGAVLATGLAVGGWAGSSVTASDLASAVKGVADSAVSTAVFTEYKNTVNTRFDGVVAGIDVVAKAQDRLSSDVASMRNSQEDSARELRDKISKLEDLVRDLSATSSTLGQDARGR